MGDDLRARLRRLPLFDHLKPDQLAWLEAHSELTHVVKNAYLFRQGDFADHFYVVVSGEVQLVEDADGQPIIVMMLKAGGFTGEVPVLSGSIYPTSARAVTDADLLRFDNPNFRELFGLCPTMVAKMFSTLSARIQSTERFARQQEKMAALGVMAAGLVHELNNPAAAAGRAATTLRTMMGETRPLLAALARTVDDSGMDALSDMLQNAAKSAKTVQNLDVLERADRESALDDWLYDTGLDDLVELAPALVNVGVIPSQLDELRDIVGEGAMGNALRWLNNALNGDALLNEVEQSAKRISDIVKAVKSYSYADQAPVAQSIDVHEGIEDTLTIMAFKLRKHNITVAREFDRTLPRIEAFGSELPQVWTNIIDNAIDAMGERGTIKIRTWRDGENACIEIGDTGPGIPDDVQARIFEAFFTTKAMGKGTGLGLDIAYRIVNRHRGDIHVESQPGDTRFQVCLPIKA